VSAAIECLLILLCVWASCVCAHLPGIIGFSQHQNMNKWLLSAAARRAAASTCGLRLRRQHADVAQSLDTKSVTSTSSASRQARCLAKLVA
jgi:hypothetical protein